MPPQEQPDKEPEQQTSAQPAKTSEAGLPDNSEEALLGEKQTPAQSEVPQDEVPKNVPEKSEHTGKIQQLRDHLYSRDRKPLVERQRRSLQEKEYAIERRWRSEKQALPKTSMHSLIKLLLIISLIFFVSSIALSSFFFFRTPAISPDNVAIEIQGPASIGGGDELGLQISIINNNPVAIEQADLIIEYPDGTRSVENINQAFPRARESLGTLASGERVNRTARAILFGEEGSVQNVTVAVEFRVSGSNAIFFNDAVYQLSLSESPLSLVVEMLAEAISGQEVEIVARIQSNSKEVIEDVLFEIEYPFGFELSDASPRPAFADRLWQLGDIAPEGEKVVRITGTLVGQDGEERVFRFKTGIESERSPNTLESIFINVLESVVVKRPFIAVDLALDGDSSDPFVTQSGRRVRGDIIWQNNLSSQIFDGEIELLLSGDVLNKLTVSADKGFYDSSSNRIVWTRTTKEDLATIPAGSSGRASFSFAPLGLSSGIPFRNPTIGIEVTVRAKRLSENQVPEEIVSTVSREVRVATDLLLTTKALHFTGPLTNTGPIPPRAEQETTFTIVWTVTNSSNEVENATVVATLPPFVSWKDVVSSSAENIEYNPVGGIVTWRLGDVAPGTGSVLPAREIAFQVGLLPSLSQIGDSPQLTNQTSISGHDVFSDTQISRSGSGVTSAVREPGFENGNGDVVF